MILSVIAIIISSIAVVISVLTFYYHFLLKAKITIDYSNDEKKPYIVEGEIDGINYKWVRVKAVCSNENFNVSAKNLHLKMLNVEKFDEGKQQWLELNPMNLFYLRWVIEDGSDQFTYSGDLNRFEPQYFNLATLVDDKNKQLLYPGIRNQGKVVGWKPEEWFKEGLFRYTIGVYGDNVMLSDQETDDYNIKVAFKKGGKVSFSE